MDTNLLVYAHREDLPWHATAAATLTELASSRVHWAIPWPCLHEFLAKVTHPRIFKEPSGSEDALEFIRELTKAPRLRLLVESEGYFQVLERLVTTGRVLGPMVHDARIAALCLVHGATELWTADRDFGRFPELKVRNPLVG